MFVLFINRRLVENYSLKSMIKNLSKEVQERIAAGEIIFRPFNALKELIENSIDANSSNISVEVKNGGKTLLQITDNGCGIRTEDFPILCLRFTTSKIQNAEDLLSIGTRGFRGEALNAISVVGKLTITSKISGENAYSARYTKGKLEGYD